MAGPIQRHLFCSPAESAFREFHAKNPLVYHKLVEFAFQAFNSGRGRFGIAALFERLRWWSRIETTGQDYKLNNNFRAYYARKLMQEYPELDGFFETRRSAADEGDE